MNRLNINLPGQHVIDGQKVIESTPRAYIGQKLENGEATLTGATYTRMGARYITGDGTLQHPFHVRVPGMCEPSLESLIAMEHEELARNYLYLLGGFNVLADSMANDIRYSERNKPQQEPGSYSRVTSTDINERGQRVAYVREATQYGAVVYHPACSATRTITGELGAKCVTHTHIGILKGLGYEVRTTGEEGRTL